VSALRLTASTIAKIERFKLARAAHFDHISTCPGCGRESATERAYDDAARDLAAAIVLDDDAARWAAR
jgi:hypothetical protein